MSVLSGFHSVLLFVDVLYLSVLQECFEHVSEALVTTYRDLTVSSRHPVGMKILRLIISLRELIYVCLM